MVDLERLKQRGLRAYERARLRVALRIVVLLVPAFAVCWYLGDRELCACLMPLLATFVVWMRWRDRRGVDDVTAGLLAGSIPLIAGVLLSTMRTSCGGPLCLAFSSLAGLGAGAWVALEVRRRGSPWSSSLAATAIAATAAVLGCSALGAFGIAGVLAGVVVGSLGATVATRPGTTS